MGIEELQQDIPWANWKKIWTLWFDPDCDGNADYIKKMFKPSKIDQVINYYGIPYIYKNEYKKYLKYRIQPRHCQVVTDYFSVILRSEWYDTSDFDFAQLQEEYNRKVPVAEATWLELHINYAEFLEKDRQHRESILKWENSAKDEQIWQMQSMMQQMMIQMEDLKKQIWNPNVLLSKEITNDWQQPSWSDSGTNAEWNSTDTSNTTTKDTTLQENGETWITTEDSSVRTNTGTSEPIQWNSERTEWSELIWSDTIDSSNNWGTNKPFAIPNTNETVGEVSEWTTPIKKDRRMS